MYRDSMWKAIAATPAYHECRASCVFHSSPELQNRDRTTLISKDVLVQAEKQASAIHADKGAPQAAIPQNPGQAAAGGRHPTCA